MCRLISLLSQFFKIFLGREAGRDCSGDRPGGRIERQIRGLLSRPTVIDNRSGSSYDVGGHSSEALHIHDIVVARVCQLVSCLVSYSDASDVN